MNSSDSPMEVAVIGVGRMGRHHARIYKNLPSARLVAVVDANSDRAEEVADQCGCRSYTRTDELIASHPNLKAVSIAVPTLHHAQAAQPLLLRRIACLVEKPLAPDAAQARILADLASQCRAVLQVGHTERYNPAVRAVRAMNILPRFMEVQRISPMTFRSLDVGVVMDMMIHDLDIVLTLAQSALCRIDAAGVAVLGKHEDIANARLVFANGCVANLTASRLALKTERKMRLFSETAYVSLDYAKRNGLVIRKSENAQAMEDVRNQLQAGADLSNLDYSNLVHVDQLTMDLPPGQEDPLTAELSSFLDAVRNGRKPEVDGQAGFDAVDAAQRVVEAIHAHTWENLQPPFNIQT